MVVTAMIGVVAAAAGNSISNQARRQRAVDAARHALQPHLIARDRAVGARTCSETLLIPALGRGAMPTLPLGVPPIAQRKNPMVAVVQWARCGFSNSVVRVDLVELEGEVDFSIYNGATDGRLVFAEDGAITSVLPTTAGAPPSGATCSPRSSDGSDPNRGVSDPARPPPGGRCEAPPPPPPPPPDVTFTVTTFFGETHDYHVFARVGATEAR